MQDLRAGPGVRLGSGTPFGRSWLGVGRGTFGPLWISLEGFLEESVLNLSASAPGPSHHRFMVTSMPLPSACHAPPMTLQGRRVLGEDLPNTWLLLDARLGKSDCGPISF